jgi:hypothetical protein
VIACTSISDAAGSREHKYRPEQPCRRLDDRVIIENAARVAHAPIEITHLGQAFGRISDEAPVPFFAKRAQKRSSHRPAAAKSKCFGPNLERSLRAETVFIISIAQQARPKVAAKGCFSGPIDDRVELYRNDVR